MATEWMTRFLTIATWLPTHDLQLRSGVTLLTDILLTGESIDLDIQENVRCDSDSFYMSLCMYVHDIVQVYITNQRCLNNY